MLCLPGGERNRFGAQRPHSSWSCRAGSLAPRSTRVAGTACPARHTANRIGNRDRINTRSADGTLRAQRNGSASASLQCAADIRCRRALRAACISRAPHREPTVARCSLRVDLRLERSRGDSSNGSAATGKKKRRSRSLFFDSNPLVLLFGVLLALRKLFANARGL